MRLWDDDDDDDDFVGCDKGANEDLNIAMSSLKKRPLNSVMKEKPAPEASPASILPVKQTVAGERFRDLKSSIFPKILDSSFQEAAHESLTPPEKSGGNKTPVSEVLEDDLDVPLAVIRRLKSKPHVIPRLEPPPIAHVSKNNIHAGKTVGQSAALFISPKVLDSVSTGDRTENDIHPVGCWDEDEEELLKPCLLISPRHSEMPSVSKSALRLESIVMTSAKSMSGQDEALIAASVPATNTIGQGTPNNAGRIWQRPPERQSGSQSGKQSLGPSRQACVHLASDNNDDGLQGSPEPNSKVPCKMTRNSNMKDQDCVDGVDSSEEEVVRRPPKRNSGIPLTRLQEEAPTSLCDKVTNAFRYDDDDDTNIRKIAMDPDSDPIMETDSDEECLQHKSLKHIKRSTKDANLRRTKKSAHEFVAVNEKPDSKARKPSASQGISSTKFVQATFDTLPKRRTRAMSKPKTLEVIEILDGDEERNGVCNPHDQPKPKDKAVAKRKRRDMAAGTRKTTRDNGGGLAFGGAKKRIEDVIVIDEDEPVANHANLETIRPDTKAPIVSTATSDKLVTSSKTDGNANAAPEMIFNVVKSLGRPGETVYDISQRLGASQLAQVVISMRAQGYSVIGDQELQANHTWWTGWTESHPSMPPGIRPALKLPATKNCWLSDEEADESSDAESDSDADTMRARALVATPARKFKPRASKGRRKPWFRKGYRRKGKRSKTK